MPGDYDIEYASPFAGANVLPMSERDGSRWERRTWPELKRICEELPEAGIHFQKAIAYRRERDLDPAHNALPMDPLFLHDPWYQELLPNFRELNTDEVPAGYDSGCTFDSLCINVTTYLQWLLGQCLKNGVVVKRGIISHIKEAKNLSHTGLPADMVINTTGLGSLKLGGVEDKTMAPYRGQTVLVRNECTPMYVTSGTDDEPADLFYLMQRAGGGGTILGGTYDKNNWESVPDPNVANRIMERVVKLCPQIADGKGVSGLSVIRHAVGLRPYREGGVRIERETLDGVEVIHNYGHAGWGYQGSYGAAERVIELVNEVRVAKGEDLSGQARLFVWDDGSNPAYNL
ncbi:hypothetical protein VHEMI06055 [[Torrubiella] hemipterigena]|nr:hypothetical protein VHEMI06055 [[Torrubiella] hemipterigena]